ncbi:lipid droplet-associated protein [Saccharopolyspora sp. NPDC049357]|uniref:lipid droplet-associated protein n=1 Tax=Saccharopolyspora sp. NPDC049357 TaxID=3154507 RepID=UPI00342921AB
MSVFPFPVRVAAGLAATAVEQARALPATLLGMPVTVASQALQASMRVQQHITELAIKGDEALSGLRTPEEEPSWATFDEDFAAEPEVVGEPEGEENSLLADYDALSLPQLRGRLRSFTEDDLTELLAHEERNQQRPDYLRMLRNRLTRLREQ